MEDKTIKDLAIGAMLLIGGIVSIIYGDNQLAGVCFGALAGYTIKNGYNRTKQP